MSVVEPERAGVGLLARVRDILFRPGRTWDAIEAETPSAGELLKTYAAPLAAIPAVCRAIGDVAFRGGLFGVQYRPTFLVTVLQMLADFGLAFVRVTVLALAIYLLAPAFGGRRSLGQALKLSVYSATAAWIAGFALLQPTVGFLIVLLAWVYGLYLLFLGLPKLMKVQGERTLTYFAAILVVAVVMGVALETMNKRLREMGGPVAVILPHVGR